MEEEVEVIGSADAVVDPWTVMVVTFYTSITDVAMSASWKSNDLTLWT